MTKQIGWPFIWERQRYYYSHAERDNIPFDPKTYGLSPMFIATNCWAGFFLQYSVRDDRLYLDNLNINCRNGCYPPINGVCARKDEYSGYHVYTNIDMPLDYTGTITIANDPDPRHYRTFGYEYELYFNRGRLTGYKDCSTDEAKAFRRLMEEELKAALEPQRIAREKNHLLSENLSKILQETENPSSDEGESEWEMMFDFL